MRLNSITESLNLVFLCVNYYVFIFRGSFIEVYMGYCNHSLTRDDILQTRHAVMRLASRSHLLASNAVKRHLDAFLVKMVLQSLKAGELGL